MMTKLPLSLLILRTIYEWRLWVVLPLALAWLAYAAYLLLNHRKWFFVWLLVIPFFIGPLDIAATYCGWHYRMELRQRYATISPTDKTYSIERMPPDIHQEYARHDYHPRLRDIKAKVLWNTLLLFFFALSVFFFGYVVGKRSYRSDCSDKHDNPMQISTFVTIQKGKLRSGDRE